jgi:hypothetical protein
MRKVSPKKNSREAVDGIVVRVDNQRLSDPPRQFVILRQHEIDQSYLLKNEKYLQDTRRKRTEQALSLEVTELNSYNNSFPS